MTKHKDICPLCGGAKKAGTTTFAVDLGFGVVVVRNIPAKICAQCGADWIPDESAEQLENIINQAKINKQQIAVSVFERKAR